MPTMLEVEPEVVTKIQARARALGVSVDEYLRELVDKKETESKTKAELSSQERVCLLREWASSHNINTALLSDNAFLTTQLVAVTSTRIAINLL